MDDVIVKANEIMGIFGGEYILQFIVIAAVFLPCPKRRLWLLSYFIGLAAILLLAAFLPVPVPWFYVVYFVLIALQNALVYRYRFLQIVFISVCMYCLQHIVSCISYGIIFLAVGIVGSFDIYWCYYLIMPAVMAAVMVAAYFTIVRRIVRAQEMNFNNGLIVIIACGFIISAAMLTHWVRESIFFWSFFAIAALQGIAVLYSLMTLTIIFMNIKTMSLRHENVILTQLLNKDKQHYEQTKISNEKIQIKYHDMKKLQKDGIINYPELSEVTADQEILFSTYFTGNSALDVVLSEKALLCERLGIRFVCTADGKAVDFIKPHHIYSFMINALENCIENVRQRADHREVDVVIMRKDNMCIIKTENYTDNEKIEMRDGVPETTKSNKEEHGFGVKSMKNIVELYGGCIRFYVENHNFTVIALIPVPDDNGD